MSQSELQHILDMLHGFTWGETLEDMRSQFNESFAFPPHPTAQTRTLKVDGVPADLVSVPQSHPEHIVLYLHGGGFAMGSCDTYHRAAADLAEAARANVLVIDYRLAPEHPYPAALENTLTAYRWLINTQGFRPEQVAIAGDSAGGNLVLASLLSLRDAGEALPASAVVISPYCDQTRTSPTLATHTRRDPIVTPQLLDTVTDWYTSKGVLKEDCRNPLISPLFADLSNLPPLMIHVGASEILLDDALQLARQIGLANGTVDLKVWQNMIHGVHLFAPMLSEGRQAIADIAVFLNQHWYSYHLEKTDVPIIRHLQK